MLKTIDFSKMCDCKRGGNPVRLYKTDWFCTRCRKKTIVKPVVNGKLNQNK